MKTLLLLLLLVSTSVQAQVAAATGTGISQPAAIRKPSYHNHPVTPLLYEDFENPVGYDLPGWTESILGGTIDEDYTVTVLYGTQSLFFNQQADNPATTIHTFTANNHVWLSFRFRPTTIPDPDNSLIFRLNDASDNCQFRITLNNDGGEFRFQFACSGATFIAGNMTVDTTYTVWVEYFNDNGANSYGSLAFSTGPIRPTSGTGFVDGTGTSTATQVSKIQIGHDVFENGQEVDFIMDHLLIDDEQIGSWP